MKKLFTVLALSVAFLGLVVTPSSAAPERYKKAYVPIYGCQDFYAGLDSPWVSYDGHHNYFKGGTFRTGADQSCNGGQVRANLVTWIPEPPLGMGCGYVQPERYTLSGVFIAAGVPKRFCPGGNPVSLGTYGGNTRIGFRWWNENAQYNHDQMWANIHFRL